MTLPPLPDVPCVRVNMGFTDALGNKMGVRFFLSYSGSAPTGGDCTTLASDISSTFSSDIKGLVNSSVSLTEVDVLDIASYSGASGQWTGSIAGTLAGTAQPIQCAYNVEYGIARRYRGGKPRGYWPFGDDSTIADQSHWTNGFNTSVFNDTTAFFSDVGALSVGSMGTLAHVNLSYYHGFHNVTNTSGRTRAAPLYRSPNAIHDNVLSYIARPLISSQRRRRTATTY